MSLERFELSRIEDVLEKMYELQKKEHELKYGKEKTEVDIESVFGITSEQFIKNLHDTALSLDTLKDIMDYEAKG